MGARGRRVNGQTSYIVVLSTHAKERCRQYLGSARGIAQQVSAALTARLRFGVEPGKDLGIEVRIREGWRAVCYPVDVLPGRREGGWVVATVIPPEWWDEEQVRKSIGDRRVVIVDPGEVRKTTRREEIQ